MKTVKILFLTANPFDKAYLRAGKELRTIKEKLSTTIYGKDFEVEFEPATRPEDWLSALIKYKPDVVHFSGHGSPGGRLLLEGKDGQAQAVSPQVLTKLFKDYKGNTCLVILNACHSRLQADMLIEEVDCAIGMNKAIDDEIAIDFVSIFYQALGNGSSVKDAFNQGEIILGMGDEDEGKIPALVKRAGVDASKIVLGGVAEPKGQEPLSIFCIHAPEEGDFCEELNKQFAYRQHTKQISFWHDQSMEGGHETQIIMKKKLEAAQIILIMVSPNLFYGYPLHEEHIAFALGQRKNDVRVIPIIVKPADEWREANFGGLYPLPRDGRPVSALTGGKREQVVYEIAKEIGRVIDEKIGVKKK